MRTIVTSCMIRPDLADCMPQTLVNAALSAACLGLECDGVAGQGYLVGYKKRAQFLVGYKGYITIAARSSWTLEGFAVLEGDGFKFDEASGTVKHDRVLGKESERRPIAFYTVARKPGASTMLRVLSDDQVRAIRDRSDGYKAYQAGKIKSTPWVTDYVPMGKKTAQRLLANNMPMLTMQQAASLETQHDLGHVAYLSPDGTVHLDKETPPAATTPGDAPKSVDPTILEGDFETIEKPWVIYYPPTKDLPEGSSVGYESLQDYARKFSRAIELSGRRLPEMRKLNEEFILGPVRAADENLASRLIDQLEAAMS